MAYTFVLTDLYGNALGEVMNASERRVLIPLSKPATASFKVVETNPLFNNILTGDTLLKVYDGSTLRFHGQVISTEATPGNSGGGVAVAVNAIDPSFRLARRAAGKIGGAPSANPTALTGNKGDLAKQLIDSANAEGPTGVATQATSAGGTATYTPGPYKTVLACINELSDSLDGFEWQINPTEWATVQIGTFNAAARIGSTKADVSFEYGGVRSNIRTFQATRSWNDLANVAWHVADGTANAALGIKFAINDNSRINHLGTYETFVDAQNITDSTLRTALCQETVDVRGDPRRVVTFTPDFADSLRPGRVPVYGTDYVVGDAVRVRISAGGGSIPAFVDGYVRVYQMLIEIDANGKATFTPTTVDEEPADV